MNIDQKTIKEEINKISKCNLGYDDELKNNGISSIQIIEIVIDIEEIYQIEFNQGYLNEEMLKSINTIAGNVIKIVQNKG